MKFLSAVAVFALVAFSSAAPMKENEDVSDELTLNDVNEALQSLDVMEASASESELYFLKKIKRGIKRIYGGTDQTFEELEDLSNAYERVEKMMPSGESYGLWKRIKRGVKKAGRIVEKIGKAAFERKVRDAMGV